MIHPMIILLLNDIEVISHESNHLSSLESTYSDLLLQSPALRIAPGAGKRLMRFHFEDLRSKSSLRPFSVANDFYEALIDADFIPQVLYVLGARTLELPPGIFKMCLSQNWSTCGLPFDG